MNHTDAKQISDRVHFPVLQFCGTNYKVHVPKHRVRYLIKHCHILLDPKLACGTCAIFQTPCECMTRSAIFDKAWFPGVSYTEKPFYQHVVECIDWPMLSTYKNWNIINSTRKGTYI